MDHEALVDLEDSIVREIAGLVDSAILHIMNVPMERDEALEIVGRVRARVLELLPDRRHVFDLVCLPRFRRAIDTYVGRDGEP
jgi:hypothetical protein